MHAVLMTLERDAAPLFMKLKQRYARVLQRDGEVSKYVDRIGELYYGIRAPSANIFDSLMSVMQK